MQEKVGARSRLEILGSARNFGTVCALRVPIYWLPNWLLTFAAEQKLKFIVKKSFLTPGLILYAKILSSARAGHYPCVEPSLQCKLENLVEPRRAEPEDSESSSSNMLRYLPTRS